MEEYSPLLAPAIAALLALAFVLVRAWLRSRPAVTVNAWEHGLLYRDGTFVRDLPPGRYRTGDRHSARILTVIPQGLFVQPQEALSADRFQVRLSALVTFRVEAARLREVVMAELTSPEERVRLAATQALRRVIGARTLDELLGGREAMDAALLAQLRAAASLAGIEVLAAETRDLILAAEVRRMVTEAERSRREAAAALERARGEQAVLRSLANSARLLKGNPALMNLRLLHALQPAAGKGRPTVVLGGGAGLVPLAAEEGVAGEGAGDVSPPEAGL